MGKRDVGIILRREVQVDGSGNSAAASMTEDHQEIIVVLLPFDDVLDVDARCLFRTARESSTR